MFSGIQWDFPITEISQFIPQHMAVVMPFIVMILGVLLAVLVIDNLTDLLLKIVGFVAGIQSPVSPVSGEGVGADAGDNLNLDSRGSYLDIDDFVDFDQYQDGDEDDREFY